MESENTKIVDEPEEQHASPIKSGRGKGFLCYGDQVSNVPTSLKIDVVPWKTRSLTIAEETVIGELAHSINMYYEWVQKLEGLIFDDPTVQSLLDLRKGSKASRLESLKQKNSDKQEESANETDDADESDMDLSDDNPNRDDDAAGYGVFMHIKSTATPNSTYLSLTITTSSLDFIQTLLDETPANELTDFMSHLVYTDAKTTSMVHNPDGNPELTSYISGASEVPLGTHIDVLATKTLLREMFPDENAHHLSSLPATKTSYPTTYPQPSSLQAKAKKLMQKAKRNMRKINFKKAIMMHLMLKLEPSFHKRSHDNQDPPNNRKGENMKKRQKDVGEPSSRSSRQNKSLMVHAQVDTPAIQPLEQKDEYVKNHLNPEWFPKNMITPKL
ncbi:hypothetical protein Tco_0789290 [Tanacetum coccineum]